MLFGLKNQDNLKCVPQNKYRIVSKRNRKQKCSLEFIFLSRTTKKKLNPQLHYFNYIN